MGPLGASERFNSERPHTEMELFKNRTPTVLSHFNKENRSSGVAYNQYPSRTWQILVFRIIFPVFFKNTYHPFSFTRQLSIFKKNNFTAFRYFFLDISNVFLLSGGYFCDLARKMHISREHGYGPGIIVTDNSAYKYYYYFYDF